MKKKAYRTIPIQQVAVETIVAMLEGSKRLIAALDVAKEAMVVGFANGAGKTLQLVRFSHPRQSLVFMELLESLRSHGLRVEVAMEPTGSYGDPLLYQLRQRQFEVYRVDAKRCHDAKELLDGVPSQHDAKSCTLIAYLHAQALSKPWRVRSALETQARALAKMHRLYQRPFLKLCGELEADLATHWPELLQQVDWSRQWHLHLLDAYPSPAHAAADPKGVQALLQRVSRNRLKPERIHAVVSQAQHSVGVPLDPASQRVLRMTIQEMLRLREQMRQVDKQAQQLVGRNNEPRSSLGHLAQALGAMTAVVLFADLGDPATYSSSAAYQKACGLNLKERSSGKLKGQLKITKRGPARSRQYLYLAALRYIAQSAVVKAWYAKRVSKSGNKNKAVVAVMRKLSLALVHVARGQPLEFEKLFDTRRLKLEHDLAA